MSVHFSDYSSQHDVRIACTQGYVFPWGDPDSSDGVYKVGGVLYTFDTDKVTCAKCSSTDGFTLALDNLVRFKVRLGLWGISLEEYERRINDKSFYSLRKISDDELEKGVVEYYKSIYNDY